MKNGTKVSWKWGQGTAAGKVISIHPDKISIQSKGETVHRNGTKDDPAVTIEQKNGTKVLKLQSELS